MPSYLKYPSGHYAAAGRTAEVEALLGLHGSGHLVTSDDPLAAEGEQHAKRMSSHWITERSQPKPGEKSGPVRDARPQSER